MTKKSMPPETDVSPAVFLKVYRAAMAAQLDMDKINKLIQGALTKEDARALVRQFESGEPISTEKPSINLADPFRDSP